MTNFQLKDGYVECKVDDEPCMITWRDLIWPYKKNHFELPDQEKDRTKALARAIKKLKNNTESYTLTDKSRIALQHFLSLPIHKVKYQVPNQLKTVMKKTIDAVNMIREFQKKEPLQPSEFEHDSEEDV